MSDWIHSYASLRGHPKTARLARNLGVNLNEAIGLLHSLWWWSADYAPDGDLTDIEPDVIAAACGWDGDADVLISGLVKATVRKDGAGFLENESGLRIHDHYEYIGRFIEARKADATRKRGGTPADIQRTSGGTPAEGGRRERERKRERKNARDDASDGPQPSSRAVDGAEGDPDYKTAQRLAQDFIAKHKA